MGSKNSKVKITKKPSGKDSPIPGLGVEQYKRLVAQVNLPENEVKELIGRFLENNDEQRLTQEQFVQLYKTLRGENEECLHKIAKCVFRVFDRNNNLTIELREFLISYALTTRGDLKTRIELAFDLYDADHNGYLDKSEVTDVIEAMLDLLDSREKDAHEVANLCFESLDNNNDGRISKDEFVDNLMKSHPLRVLMNPFC